MGAEKQKRRNKMENELKFKRKNGNYSTNIAINGEIRVVIFCIGDMYGIRYSRNKGCWKHFGGSSKTFETLRVAKNVIRIMKRNTHAL